MMTSCQPHSNPRPVDRLVKENDMTPGNELRCADEISKEEFMMCNNVQRLGEYVTAALLGRLTP
jgi:hypothetical protein